MKDTQFDIYIYIYIYIYQITLNGSGKTGLTRKKAEFQVPVCSEFDITISPLSNEI